MSRSFGLVDTKIQEAEYFLERILSAKLDFFGVQCDAVAFAASARSVTFAMQASLKGVPEFDVWYSHKQTELKKDSLSRFFHEFRRVSQHVGHNLVKGGIYKNKTATYHFGPVPEIKSVPESDVATACTQYFTTLLNLVYECYVAFNTRINGQWFYTREHFASMGKSVEDAEESLGYPRGWTKVPDFGEDVRWYHLRRQADGCNLQSQFERWLGKRVPHPDQEHK